MKKRDRFKGKEHGKLGNTIEDYNNLFEKEKGKKSQNTGTIIKKLIKLNFWPLVLSTFVYILQAAPLWITPLITSYIINVITKTVTTGAGATADVWHKIILASVILLVIIAQNIPSTILRDSINSKIRRNTGAGIKCSVIRKLQTLSITTHKDMKMGQIQSKFLKDTETINTLLNVVVSSLIPNIIGVIITVAISLSRNGTVSLFFLVVIPINVLVSFVFRKKLRTLHRNHRIKAEKMSVRLSSMLQMMQVTKAHGLEETEYRYINDSIDQLKGSEMAVDKGLAKFGSTSWTINHLLSAICLIFCSILALKEVIEIGDIVLYQSMFTQISGYVGSLINIYPNMTSGMEALDSVAEIMNATDVEITVGKANVPSIEGNVRFENVSYCYPNTEQLVINNLSLNVKSGECIAVVGASGSGKSTLMNMIIGFLKPTEGKIYIDGKDLEDFNLSEYRHHISVVPQSSILFAGSIKENITYGLDHYNAEELERVLEMANIKEFLPDLPNGIDTDIGEYGDKLSGGQRQRITIARALIRNPKILILDEATSALDNISEFHVQKAISSSIRGRTTFIVAHRLSTIRDADRILVMDGGVVVESGTYQELMDKKGKFYELKCLNDATSKEAEIGLGNE